MLIWSHKGHSTKSQFPVMQQFWTPVYLISLFGWSKYNLCLNRDRKYWFCIKCKCFLFVRSICFAKRKMFWRLVLDSMYSQMLELRMKKHESFECLWSNFCFSFFLSRANPKKPVHTSNFFLSKTKDSIYKTHANEKNEINESNKSKAVYVYKDSFSVLHSPSMIIASSVS